MDFASAQVIGAGLAAIGVGDEQVVLAQGGRLQDGGVFTDGHFVAPRVLQRLGKVKCLIAISVVLPLSAGKQYTLAPAGAFFWARAAGARQPIIARPKQRIRV